MQEPLLVVLAVDGEHLLTDLGENPDRNRTTPDVGTGAAIRPHCSGQQQVALVELATGVLAAHHCGVVLRQDEAALDQSSTCPRTDPPSIGPASEQQRETLHDHGLARSGLAGEHGQTGRQR